MLGRVACRGSRFLLTSAPRSPEGGLLQLRQFKQVCERQALRDQPQSPRIGVLRSPTLSPKINLTRSQPYWGYNGEQEAGRSLPRAAVEHGRDTETIITPGWLPGGGDVQPEL